MTARPDKPILVTGAHRSGTTWVGKVIATAPSVGYIHEPFNIAYRPGICGAHFRYWFTYISPENEAQYHDHIKRTLQFSYDLGAKFAVVRSPKDVIRLCRDSLQFKMARLRRLRPLVKDPIALFSAEWLASSFHMDVIVLIRHPAAFTDSLKRKNWTHPFSHFLEQPLLIRDHLHPFLPEITDYAAHDHDIIDQAILLWRLTHYMISKYKKAHLDWFFIRHEDLSRQPEQGFRDIFHRIGVPWSSRLDAAVNDFSGPLNPSRFPEQSDSIRRHSQAGIWNWKTSLSQRDITRIRDRTEDISSEFYSADEW
jgi:Sulfotransferase family